MRFIGEIQGTDVQSKKVPLQWRNHLRQSLEEGCQKAVLGVQSCVLERLVTGSLHAFCRR